MFAIEARKMGYRVHTFSPDADTPTGHISDVETTAAYDDLEAVRAFANSVDVVTFEFENVPSETIAAASQLVPVHPRGEILHTTQNRLREKTFLEKNGFPVAPFRHVRSIDEMRSAAAASIGLPAVLKTAGFGYDGKGQARIGQESDIEGAFASMNGHDAVLESFVEFEKEVSVVCARGADGSFAHYGVIENDHKNHILDISFAPALVSTAIHDEAVMITRQIAEAFGYVGTMCVEFFLADRSLLVNEIAPRPHNSGHLTFGPCVTSQFEQQVRAVCGLPLGSTEFLRPAAIANLLGDIWQNGEPDWSSALSEPGVQLHLYGKSDPRPGRKMGHLTATAETAQDAAKLVRDARRNLSKQ